jgi:hypothetical protein
MIRLACPTEEILSFDPMQCDIFQPCLPFGEVLTR